MLILLCTFLIGEAQGFHQTDYEIIHHRMELVNHNKSYLRNFKAELVPLNRTTRAINISTDLLENLIDNVPLTLQAYRFSMGDYRPTTMVMKLDYCRMRKENMFGINDIAKCSNATPCPVKKGHYYINKYRPDETKFPPHIFPGDYKLVIKLMYGADLLADLHWFGTVKQIEKLQMQT